MGAFVRAQGDLGYAQGFATFIVLAVLSLVLANVLKRTHVTLPVTAARSEGV
jgi:hypothetical protein